MSLNLDLNASLKPLNEWYCDHCGKIIKAPEEGWLEWYRDILGKHDQSNGKGFRIVHHKNECMYNSRQMFEENKLTADMYLIDFTGPDGLVYLLSFIEHERVENNAELIEIIRRIHVPYYEEARRYHNKAEGDGYFDGENEITRYIESTSKHILRQYK